MNETTFSLFASKLDEAHLALVNEWGDEWRSLSDAKRLAILVDFYIMVEQENWNFYEVAAEEYKARIFAGNLDGYAACQLVRFRFGWGDES